MKKQGAAFRFKPPSTSLARGYSGGERPLVLLVTLALATLGVAALSVRLLATEWIVMEETMRRADFEVLKLVGHRAEDALLAAMQAPVTGFTKALAAGHGVAPLAEILRQAPEVTEALLLDADLGVLDAYPPAEGGPRERMDDWIVDRLVIERDERGSLPYGFQWFVHTVHRQPLLVGYQSVRHRTDGEAAGWLVLLYDLDALVQRQLRPLLDRFGKDRGMEIRLLSHPEPTDPDSVRWHFRDLLPGWGLAVIHPPSATADRLRRQRALVLAVSSLALLALSAAGLAVWRDLRRQRSLVAMKQRLVADVSHELKTPLALIRMYAETLYLGRVDGVDKQNAYLGTIVEESQRLTKMIETLLDLSRLEQGKGVLSLTQTDLQATVEAVARDYGPRVCDQGLALDLAIDADLPPVPHDRYGVTQILINLLDNACKHAASGGRVEVRVERRAPREVALVVADQGPGIPAAERNRVRLPFERGAGANRTAGAGLGLALVERIAVAHGAQLSLEAGPGGVGLAATVRFPAAGASE